jgi:hypothetical protein
MGIQQNEVKDNLTLHFPVHNAYKHEAPVKNWRTNRVSNILLEAYAVGLIGFAAVFVIVFLVSRIAGNNQALMVLMLTAGVAAILALAIAWNTTKKKL